MPVPDNSSNRSLYQRLLLRCILMFACAAVLIFIMPTAIRLLMPFVIAFIVATLLNPLVNKISQKLKVPRRAIAAILDLIVFILVFSVIGVLGYTIVNEAISLATNIQLNMDGIMAELNQIRESFTWLFQFLPPQITDLFTGSEESILEFIQNSSRSILNGIVSVTTTITTKTGNFFMNFLISILAAYFISADYNHLSLLIQKRIGKRINGVLTMLKNTVFTALGGFLKSQLLLALFAFLFMLVALLIIKQPYALLLALFLGIIDLLPIVGTIAVLLPWGIVEIVSDDMNKGIYLLVIGVVFFLVRKVVEPKIVGSQTGLHPLAALISTYVGLQFSGIWGAVLGSVILMLIISIVKSGIFDNFMADLRAVAVNVSKTMRL